MQMRNGWISNKGISANARFSTSGNLFNDFIILAPQKTIPSLDIVMFIRLTDAMKRGNLWKEKEFENLCAIIILFFKKPSLD